MADPYASRERLTVGEGPADAGPARELIGELGGLCALELGDLAAAPGGLSTDGFVAVVVRDEGPLPPIAELDPALAVLLLLRTPQGCRAANDALAALEALGEPPLLLKQGLVAGPAGREGAYTVTGELIGRLVRAARAGEIGWERDPDFGYRVAARVPGFEGRDADALCPRLLYAAADRVYEHASTVAALKRERRRRADVVPGLDPRIVAASGWPVKPTGRQWRDQGE